MLSIFPLLSDFCTAYGYVCEFNGAPLTKIPGATIVDISHDNPAHDVDLGRLTVARYWRRFPHGTVHIAVVDPGVGSARAALALASAGRYLIGTDNAQLSPALLMCDSRTVEMSVPPHASPISHSLDVLPPAAPLRAHD